MTLMGPDRRSNALSYGWRILLVIAVGGVLLISPALLLPTEAQPKASESKRDLKTVVIPIEGMVCVACVATVRKTLKSLDGVSRVEVSLEKRNAQVTYAANQLSPNQIVAAVNKLGYRAGTPREVE